MYRDKISDVKFPTEEIILIKLQIMIEHQQRLNCVCWGLCADLLSDKCVEQKYTEYSKKQKTQVLIPAWPLSCQMNFRKPWNLSRPGVLYLKIRNLAR
jgi:hypothetical protein